MAALAWHGLARHADGSPADSRDATAKEVIACVYFTGGGYAGFGARLPAGAGDRPLFYPPDAMPPPQVAYRGGGSEARHARALAGGYTSDQGGYNSDEYIASTGGFLTADERAYAMPTQHSATAFAGASAIGGNQASVVLQAAVMRRRHAALAAEHETKRENKREQTKLKMKRKRKRERERKKPYFTRQSL
ncbi:hypothetical protein T492DRAFT_850396 [Pavlovales sp. CCMP2436]|nr:hypothetical protein T492DRAFT_850396 [Pavlovales sp. CCMP2436]